MGSPDTKKVDLSCDIFALGHAIVDVEYHVSESLLTALGYDKGARYMLDEGPFQIMHAALQAPGAEAKWMAQSGGGSAANTVVTAQRLGAQCHFSARLAKDAAGWFYQQTLQQEGLTVPSSPLAEGISGQCLVLVTPDAERTMLLHTGVTSFLGPEYVDMTRLRQARCLFLESYLVTTDIAHQTTLEAVSQARSAGVPIVMSLSDAGIIAGFRPELGEWLDQPIQLIVGNESEAMAWTGANELEQALTQLAGYAEHVVITRGPVGAEVTSRGKRETITTPRVNAISSLGAGDTFAGALLYGVFAARWSLSHSAAFACACAARKVEFTGARLAREQLHWVMNKGGFADQSA